MPPRTIKEKIREALLAIKLEHSYTKDQILAKYLNTVYFGHGAYGVEAAAQTYFGVHAADLTVLQSATLVGGPARADASTTRSTARTTTSSAATTRSTRWRSTATSPRPTRDRLKAKPCCGTIPDGQAHDQGAARLRVLRRLHAAVPDRQVLRERRCTAAACRSRPRSTWAAARGRATRSTRTCPTPTTTPTPRSSRSTRTRAQILAMVGGRNCNKSKLNLATFKGGHGPPGGLGVQGVHPRGRDAGRVRPQRVLAGTGDDHDPRPGVRRPRRSLDTR